MTSHWKAVLGVILIFIFGCFSGWLGSSLAHYRQTTELLRGGPQAVAKLVEKRADRVLHLDETQQQQLHDYIMENLEKRRKLQAQIQPQMHDLNRQTLDEINAILRPDQREILHEKLAAFQKRSGRDPFTSNTGAASSSDSTPETIGTDSTQPSGTPPSQ